MAAVKAQENPLLPSWEGIEGRGQGIVFSPSLRPSHQGREGKLVFLPLKEKE